MRLKLTAMLKTWVMVTVAGLALPAASAAASITLATVTLHEGAAGAPFVSMDVTNTTGNCSPVCTALLIDIAAIGFTSGSIQTGAQGPDIAAGQTIVNYASSQWNPNSSSLTEVRFVGIVATSFLLSNGNTFVADPSTYFGSFGAKIQSQNLDGLSSGTFDVTLEGTEIPPSTVPEPASLLLVATGAAGLIRRFRRRP